MRRNNSRSAAFACAIPILLLWPGGARAQAAKAPYPVMAPLDQYLIPDEKAEIALARSAAPASISDAAEVMVLRRDGYAHAAKGSNGFVCVVERSWGKATDDAEFWNPRFAHRIASIRRPQRRFCRSIWRRPSLCWRENRKHRCSRRLRPHWKRENFPCWLRERCAT